jgi:hypothetical protein
MRRDGRGDCLGKTQFCAPPSQVRRNPFRHACDAIDDCVHWFACIGDSALGGLLSLALFPLWESSFYFSTSSYATVGYGDVVLPQAWRTLGPVESIIGVLMCGLSASFLFAIVSRSVDREARLSSEFAKLPAHLEVYRKSGGATLEE